MAPCFGERGWVGVMSSSFTWGRPLLTKAFQRDSMTLGDLFQTMSFLSVQSSVFSAQNPTGPSKANTWAEHRTMLRWSSGAPGRPGFCVLSLAPVTFGCCGSRLGRKGGGSFHSLGFQSIPVRGKPSSTHSLPPTTPLPLPASPPVVKAELMGQIWGWGRGGSYYSLPSAHPLGFSVGSQSQLRLQWWIVFFSFYSNHQLLSKIKKKEQRKGSGKTAQ